MIIREMIATFGNLEDRKLTLCSGLNILEGENESGKTTWCDFIRAMLYGIDSSERDTKSSLAIKNRYKPWSGSPMSGVMHIESGRFGRLTLERRGSAAVPMREFRAYGSAGDMMPFSGEDAGEMLLGIGREAFDRSCFIDRPEIPAGGTGELERRILSLVSAGDKDLSYSQAAERLRAWQRKIKLNRRIGEIPDTEEQIAKIRTNIAAVRKKADDLGKLNRRIRDLEEERTALLTELDIHKTAESAAASERFRNAEARLAEAEADLLETAKHLPPGNPSADEIRELERAVHAEAERRRFAETQTALIREKQYQIKDLEEQIASFRPFYGMPPDKANETVHKDRDVLRNLTVKRVFSQILRKSSLVLLLPIVISAMFFYFLPRAHAVIATVFLGLIFVPSVILFSASTAKRRVFDTQKELLEKYGTTDPIEIDQKLSSYEKLLSELSRQQSIIREMEDELAVIPSIPEETRRRICEVFPGLEDQSDMETGIRQAVSGALEVIERHSYARMLYHSAQQVVEALRSNTGMTYIGASENAVSQRRPSMPRSAIESRLEHLDRMLSSLRREAALLEGSMANDRNINELEAEAERLDLRLETLNMRYDAISLALDALGKADRLLRERFSPALNSQASGIFSAFTRRKYDKVLISREFSAMAGSGGSEGLRRALELSHGTVDQLYLAVRLALCRIVPPAGYNPPIILDDAFLAFDDVRLEAALDWLCEESKTRQVILFTCHRREGLYLTGRPGVLIQSVTRTSVTGKEC